MQISQIILDISIIILMLYIAFAKNYSQEKGKNLATKEDIAEITSKIESVKSDVQHAYSQKSQFLERNKLALITFYEEYIYWTEFSIKDISVTINHVLDSEKIRNAINDLNFQQSKVNKALWVLVLFEMDDTVFIEQIKNIFLEANKLSRLTFDYLIDIETIAVNFKIAGVISNDTLNKRDSQRSIFISNRNQQEKIVNGLTNSLSDIIRIKMIEKYS